MQRSPRRSRGTGAPWRILIARTVVAGLVSCLMSAAAARAADQKVVIIGFDGADARLVEQYMKDGKLPNLQALRDEGSYARLRPTNPPQTPVSWSAFSTGKNPGKTGIFDFLKRPP